MLEKSGKVVNRIPKSGQNSQKNQNDAFIHLITFSQALNHHAIHSLVRSHVCACTSGAVRVCQARMLTLVGSFLPLQTHSSFHSSESTTERQSANFRACAQQRISRQHVVECARVNRQGEQWRWRGGSKAGVRSVS